MFIISVYNLTHIKNTMEYIFKHFDNGCIVLQNTDHFSNFEPISTVAW